MKYLCHVPSEQYGFISVEVEGTPEEAVEAYFGLSRAIRGGDGIDNKVFLALLDELWTKKSISGDPGIISDMSKSQQEIVRAVKLMIKRNEK